MPNYTERFLHFMPLLIDIEGGDCTDTGGRTRFGISKNAFPDEDIENLTIERAYELYWEYFYVPMNCDNIDDDHFAFQFFVAAINIGITDAKRHIWTLLAMPLNGQVVGNVTLEKLNTAIANDRDGIYSKFLLSMAKHYFDLAEQNPEKYGTYLRTLINRLLIAIDL